MQSDGLDRGSAKHLQHDALGQWRLRSELHPESVCRRRSNLAVRPGNAPDFKQCGRIAMGRWPLLLEARLRIHHAQPRTRMGQRTVVRAARGRGRSRLRLLSGRLPDVPYSATSLLKYPNPALPPYPNAQAANPNGVVFNDNNPDEILKQAAIFGEATYKFTDALKLTGGTPRLLLPESIIMANQAGFGTASWEPGSHQPSWQSFNNNATAAEAEPFLRAESGPDGVRHDRQRVAARWRQSAHTAAERPRCSRSIRTPSTALPARSV